MLNLKKLISIIKHCLRVVWAPAKSKRTKIWFLQIKTYRRKSKNCRIWMILWWHRERVFRRLVKVFKRKWPSYWRKKKFKTWTLNRSSRKLIKNSKVKLRSSKHKLRLSEKQMIDYNKKLPTSFSKESTLSNRKIILNNDYSVLCIQDKQCKLWKLKPKDNPGNSKQIQLKQKLSSSTMALFK